MDITPASSYEPGAFDAFASAGAYAGDAGADRASDDPIEVRTSDDAGSPAPQDGLLDDARNGISNLERRFAAFTQVLRRELSSLESRCASALRSLFAPAPQQSGSAVAGPGAAAGPGGASQAGSSRYAGIVDAAARRNRLDPALLDAVIGQESAFRPDAVSTAGAVGLMQLMPATAKELGVADPFDPAQNVEGGAKYLRSLIDRYGGRLDLALAAYDAGPGAVDRFGGIPPYAETQRYVASIMAGYRSAVLHAG